jgi:hypothetical protein
MFLGYFAVSWINSYRCFEELQSKKKIFLDFMTLKTMGLQSFAMSKIISSTTQLNIPGGMNLKQTQNLIPHSPNTFGVDISS